MKNYILLFLIIALPVGVVMGGNMSDAVYRRELGIKAAFIYNFIQFVSWPEGETTDDNESIVIGLINVADDEEAFNQIKGKEVAGRKIVIKKLTINKDSKQDWENEFKKCQVLFFYAVDRVILSQMMNNLKGWPILVVGQQSGFLEQGGIINFIKEKDKIRFEVNLVAASNSNLTIRSKLLKLAKRVIAKEK